MAMLLPKQRLLLELLIMSGDIALADDIAGTILERTTGECERKGWVERRIDDAGGPRRCAFWNGIICGHAPSIPKMSFYAATAACYDY